MCLNPDIEGVPGLTATDVFTGFTVNRAIINEALKELVKAIDEIRDEFPYPIIHILSGGGYEFLIDRVAARCGAPKIRMTRSQSLVNLRQNRFLPTKEVRGYLPGRRPESMRSYDDQRTLDQKIKVIRIMLEPQRRHLDELHASLNLAAAPTWTPITHRRNTFSLAPYIEARRNHLTSILT